MNKLIRRGRKWIGRVSGPDLEHLRSENVYGPTTNRLQAGLPLVLPSDDFRRRLNGSLMERALAMSARKAWYQGKRARRALAGAAAGGVALAVAGTAAVFTLRRRNEISPPNQRAK